MDTTALARKVLRGWQSAALVFGIGVLGAGSASAELLDGVKVASLEEARPAAVEEKKQPQQIVARVDLSDQTMTVYVGEKLSYVFPVSSGRRGYGTPTGRWNAEWLSPNHRSRKYDNAPMPWSVFFYRGYAVHGTTAVRNLGRPASHGCIRLAPENAKTFFKLVQANGKENTLVSIVR